MTPPICPVFRKAETAAKLANSLSTTLFELRIAMQQCADCHLAANCGITTWTATIDAALQDLAQEWQL